MSLSINDLSNDILSRILATGITSTQLRLAAGTCRRWANLLRTRVELWRRVELSLPPKRSRGRDRRNSYTTPCALNLDRLAVWLVRRRAAIAELEVALLYPDAEALLPQLLPPLAPALRSLVLRGNCSDWPYKWVDWRWLAGMTQLERLELRNALPGMSELLLPPSLSELHIDRVGEGDPDTEGWDELPDCFSRLTRLQSLTLGTAATYLLQADEESAFTPLRACRGLRELRVPDGALTAVPDALTALTTLTLLSFHGCDRLEGFGELCQHMSDPFAPLRTLRMLRHLDFSRCALDQVPPGLGSLLELRTLLLADNQLTALPAGTAAAGAAVAPSPAARTGAGRGGSAASGSVPVLPPQLEELDVAGNLFTSLPGALFSGAAAQLTALDLSRCWQLAATPADWRRLLAAMPRLRRLRHSCPLLAAEARGCGGGGRLAAAVGGSQELQLEYRPSASSLRHRRGLDADAGPNAGGSADAAPSGSGGSNKRVRSCSSLRDLEQQAAAALLSGGGRGGGADCSSGSSGGNGSSSDQDGGSSGGDGAGAHATLADLAATAAVD